MVGTTSLAGTQCSMGTVSTDHRTQALERLRELRERLLSDVGDRDAVIAECDALITAVDAFHMEAIRFRMYGLHRRLTRDETVAAEVVALLEDARMSLGAAGFKV